MSHHPGRVTHIIIAALVVLIFGLYVDGELGQEGALGRGRDLTFLFAFYEFLPKNVFRFPASN